MPIIVLLYPLAEIFAWYWFISNFGWGDAILWCFASAFVGIWIMRLQGGTAMAELQNSARNATLPPSRVVHRLLMSFGAFLLVLPGLITKTIGALLILPGLRHFVVWFALWRLGTKAAESFVRFGRMGPLGGFVFTRTMDSRPWESTGSERESRPPERDVIDVQATVLPERPTKTENQDQD